MTSRQRLRHRRPFVIQSPEMLEPRLALTALSLAPPLDHATVQRTIVAGDPNGSPADSPTNRVDENIPQSPFSGVGSLKLETSSATYICTGTLITAQHVLTAGHCVDFNDDGAVDIAPSKVTFNLNADGDFSDQITASSINVHPNYTGFANPSVLDDLAIIELSKPADAGAKVYGLYRDPFVNIERITLAGYGLSGDPVNGYTAGPKLNVKRSGENRADVYMVDDEGSGAREGFQFDFDSNQKRHNVYGSPVSQNLSLGNDIETIIGGGDSGGPSFVPDGNGNLLLFGVNTFTGGGGKAAAPYFGSIGGGIVVSAYADWIDGIIGGVNQAPQANAGTDQNRETGQLVTLNGSSSFDPEGQPLSYNWTLLAPPGGDVPLFDTTTAQPSFTPTVAGTYTATLVVNDGELNSAPDTVLIHVGEPGTGASSVHVSDLSGSANIKGKSDKWSATVVVTILDNQNNPASGASVSVTWSAGTLVATSGLTGTDGTVSFTSSNLTGVTSVELTVTDVNGSLAYTLTDNVETSIVVNIDGSSSATRTVALVASMTTNDSLTLAAVYWQTAMIVGPVSTDSCEAELSDTIDQIMSDRSQVELISAPTVVDSVVARWSDRFEDDSEVDEPQTDEMALDELLAESSAV